MPYEDTARDFVLDDDFAVIGADDGFDPTFPDDGFPSSFPLSPASSDDDDDDIPSKGSDGRGRGVPPVARIAIMACVCVLVAVGAFLAVTAVAGNITERRDAAIAQAQAEAQEAADAEAKRQKELLDALSKRDEAADAANQAFGDRVIQLRPEQTPEELEESLPPVGVDGSAISPQTDGRAMWVTLEEGDTLSALAEYFNTDVRTIMELNGLDEGSALYAGDMIRVG